MDQMLVSRALGCVVGSSIGDALGGVVETVDAARLKKLTGGDWADAFLPYPDDHPPHPLGVWIAAPPRGTGTDDTRNNHILLETAAQAGRAIDSRRLAQEYVARYRHAERFYGRHVEIAQEHYRHDCAFSLAYLGSREFNGKPLPSFPELLGGQRPCLTGLISLAFAGLLFPGEPEEAYRKAFELDFMDTGYARDATAIMAAMVSRAAGGAETPDEMIEAGLAADPFEYGRGRIMGEALQDMLRITDEASDDRDLVDRWARYVAGRHIYDPTDVLGISAAALRFSGGDPVRTIVTAVNDRTLDTGGELVELRDVDCTGSVAGALVGALRGIESFPSEWVEDTLQANRDVYGLDLEANTHRFLSGIGVRP